MSVVESEHRDQPPPPPQPPTEPRAEGSSALRLALLVGAVGFLGVRWGLATVVIVLALVVIIFLHELGHYLTAKAAGMKVTEFFIGFGPKIWSFQKGETEYGVKAIPAGAYVKIIGMSNLDEVDPADEERTYRAKPYWRRLSVAVAGSTMHFILAFLLICGVFMGFGQQMEDRWTLNSVSGPAEQAGLQPGDRVRSVDGRPVGTFEAMTEVVRGMPGETVEVEVERGGAVRTVEVALAERNPSTGEDVGYLGVSPAHPRVTLGPIEGAVDGVQEMWHVGKESVLGLGRLFSPDGASKYVDNLSDSGRSSTDVRTSTDRPSSVIGIVNVGSQVAEEGVVNVLYLLFAVNMFIGLFNLTPILPFDGGHVLIATYEKIRSMISGRRYQADVAKLMPLTYAVVLVLAFVFVTSIYMDIVSPQSIR